MIYETFTDEKRRVELLLYWKHQLWIWTELYPEKLEAIEEIIQTIQKLENPASNFQI